MLKELKSWHRIWPVAFCLLLAMLFSCGSRDNYVGSYTADPKDTPRQVAASLELKENGEGIWKVGDEEVPFSWEARQNELRVNTKDGGVIVGKFGRDGISLSLPGSKMMLFRKAR